MQAFGKSEGYGEAFLSQLELTVHEAFVNAVMHGNGSDPDLPVTIILRENLDNGVRYLQVEIGDCGKGFLLGERHGFEKCGEPDVFSGRGLPLIAHYTDSLRSDNRPDGSVLILRYISS